MFLSQTLLSQTWHTDSHTYTHCCSGKFSGQQAGSSGVNAMWSFMPLQTPPPCTNTLVYHTDTLYTHSHLPLTALSLSGWVVLEPAFNVSHLSHMHDTLAHTHTQTPLSIVSVRILLNASSAYAHGWCTIWSVLIYCSYQLYKQYFTKIVMFFSSVRNFDSLNIITHTVNDN